jgi:hypothetical protein
MHREIRADFDRDSIVVYQAYNDVIADAAVRAGRFVAPFSLLRMTWIKPSFLWLMERSNWGKKSGQTRILAVRLTQAGFLRALNSAVLTNHEARVHTSPEQWRRDLDNAAVHVQWDTERSLRGAPLNIDAIQLGIGRELIAAFANEWTLAIDDLTPTVVKMSTLIAAGQANKAKALLPPEKPWPVTDAALRRRLGMVP